MLPNAINVCTKEHILYSSFSQIFLLCSVLEGYAFFPLGQEIPS